MIKKGDKRTIRGWIFYDWANSVYPLVITTALFPTFYEGLTKGENGEGVINFFGFELLNTAAYSYVISASFLVVSIMSPMLSGIADFVGRKKLFLQFFCYLGAFSCASLFFFDKNALEVSMISVFLTSIGFWGSLVFYNAYLPEIAERKDHDKISARGYSMGYIGSSLLLIVLLIPILMAESQGWDKEFIVRISFVITALWWIGFARLTYRVLPKQDFERRGSNTQILSKGFAEIRKVFQYIRKTKRLKRYLITFFVLSMGVQTVMLMATLFGLQEVKGMQQENLIISVLIIQFVGSGGAFLFSWISKKKGNMFGLRVALIYWVFICISAWFVRLPWHFYLIAVGVGIIMGGIQSLSRSTYAKFLPETEDHASFFSFYDVAEKVAIVIGTLSYGLIGQITGSMRNAIVALTIFFITALIVAYFIPKEEIEIKE